MSDAEYYEAQVPEPWTLLGLPLMPLSAGHIILLNRIESPFVAGDAVEWEDLACAVFICSKTFEESLAAFTSPDLEADLTEWHRKLIAEHGEIDFTAKVSEFHEYLKDGTKHPEYLTHGGGSGVGDVAAIQFVKVALMNATGISESQFLNQPWRVSMWDFLTHCASRGQLEIVESNAIPDAFEVGRKLMEAFKAGKIQPCQR